jgi:hypothetical protein
MEVECIFKPARPLVKRSDTEGGRLSERLDGGCISVPYLSGVDWLLQSDPIPGQKRQRQEQRQADTTTLIDKPDFEIKLPFVWRVPKNH